MEDLTIDADDFYEKLNVELEFYLSTIKKSLDALIDMRVESALMELEYTSMLDASCWTQIQELYECPVKDTGTEDSKNSKNA